MRVNCRHCNTPLVRTFCDLGTSPLANSYLHKDRLNAGEVHYPLATFVCETCFLVQLPEFEAPSAIFSDYAYFSSYSDSWVDHARRFVDMAVSRFGLGETSRVIEIASNDGYLLQFFVQKGIPALGIEPAANIAKVAREQRGIESIVDFFGNAVATRIRQEGRTADLLIGNNVLAHVPDINDFVASLKIALNPEGVISIEFPHLLQLMRYNQFDTIYHEHFSYLSLGTVERIFRAHGLRIFDVEEVSTHGGSLRIFATHAEAKGHATSEGLSKVRADEKAARLELPETYSSFGEAVQQTKRSLLKFLISAKDAGNTVVGYGAPAKGVTLLNFCGIGTDLLEYTVDRSAEKQGRYMPGVRIPIHSPEMIERTRPDYVLILPWNLKDEIVTQMAPIRAWGGKFVVAIPEVEIIE